MENKDDYPENGDSIYKKSGEYDVEAWLNKDKANYYSFSMGYRHTFQLLCNCINENMNKRDYLINPLLFNLRHYLELVLKSILENVRFVLFVEQPEMFDEKSYKCIEKHQILKLWDVFIENYSSIVDIRSNENIKATRALLVEIDKIDSNGENFRYPFGINKNNKKVLDYIDVYTIANIGNKLINILEGLYSQSKNEKAN